MKKLLKNVVVGLGLVTVSTSLFAKPITAELNGDVITYEGKRYIYQKEDELITDNQIIVNGKYKLSIDSAMITSRPENKYDKNSGKKLVRVDMTFTNLSKTPQTPSVAEWKVYDKHGVELETEFCSALNLTTPYTSVLPNKTVKFTSLYAYDESCSEITVYAYEFLNEDNSITKVLKTKE